MSYIDALRIDGTDYEIKDSKAIHRDEWLDIIYPIGSIYWNKRNSNNPSEYLGGEWEPITNQVLVAAGTTFPINTSGGSKDAVVVSHNHTQNAHTHTQNAHTHSQNAHTHAQYSHDHLHDHKHYPTGGAFFLTSNFDIAAHGTKRAWPAASSNGVNYVYSPSGGGINESSFTGDAVGSRTAGTEASNKYTTATNNNATATNNNTTATNNAAGVSGTNKNMPPYVTAYCWERIG